MASFTLHVQRKDQQKEMEREQKALLETLYANLIANLDGIARLYQIFVLNRDLNEDKDVQNWNQLQQSLIVLLRDAQIQISLAELKFQDKKNIS